MSEMPENLSALEIPECLKQMAKIPNSFNCYHITTFNFILSLFSLKAFSCCRKKSRRNICETKHVGTNVYAVTVHETDVIA